MNTDPLPSCWTRSKDRRELIKIPAATVPTADGTDESHISVVGKIERRLDLLRERRAESDGQRHIRRGYRATD